MPDVILMVGIPASGKSSWAKASKLPTVSRDTFRNFFTREETKSVLGFKEEEIITKLEFAQAKSYLDAGLSVVVDDMNLRPKYVKEWIKFAHENNSQVDIVKFPVDVEEAVRRNSLRPNAVPEDALRSIAKKFTDKGRPTVDLLKCYEEVVSSTPPKLNKYKPDESKQKAIIVDLDGTLAHNNSGRGWYVLDDSYYNDDVDKSVQFVARAFIEDGYQVIFMSGRDERTRAVTERWLVEKAGFTEPTLFMRPAKDSRTDSIVKSELFDKYVRYNYCVELSIDDRAQVCQMWRSISLPVWQVAEGNY